MPGFGNTMESDLLKLIFNATTIANIAINATASPLTNLYVALHTADPGKGGAQNTSEVAYTNYARIAVVRTTSGWTVSGTAPTLVSNAAAVTFATCGVTGATALFWSVGTLISGAGIIIASGPLSSSPVGAFEAEESNERISIKNHALALDDRIVFNSVGALALPTGITGGTVYYVGTIEEAVAQRVIVKLKNLKHVVKMKEAWEDIFTGRKAIIKIH